MKLKVLTQIEYSYLYIKFINTFNPLQFKLVTPLLETFSESLAS